MTSRPFLAAIDDNIKYFNDGDIVEGWSSGSTTTKSSSTSATRPKGVIPSRSCPSATTSTPPRSCLRGCARGSCPSERRQRRPVLTVQEARPIRARVGQSSRTSREEDGIVDRECHRGRQGRPDPTSACVAFSRRRWSRCAACATRTLCRQRAEGKIIELDKNRNNVVSRRAWPEKTKSDRALRPSSRPWRRARSVRRCLVDRQLRRVRRPRRCRRPRARVGAVLEAHRPSLRGLLGAATRSTVRSSTSTWPRARLPVASREPRKTLGRSSPTTQPAGRPCPERSRSSSPSVLLSAIAPGIEGLVHISELAGEPRRVSRGGRPVGDEVVAKVIDIDWTGVGSR